MNASSVVTVVGGLGLFLLGVHHLTEGLKGLAGDSLRRTLQAMVGGRLSAIISGALFSALLQSSTATTLTVIGFVSAGLVTFLAGGRGYHRRDFWHNLNPMAGGDLWLSSADFRLCHADGRYRRFSLADRQGQNAFGRSHPGGLRTALCRDRLSAERDGGHLLEPRLPSAEAPSAGSGSSPESGY